MDVRTQIERFEGRRYEAYPDPLSPLAAARRAGKPTEGLSGDPWTIGIGHTGPEVHEGLVWTDAEIDAAFTIDLEKAREECLIAFPWFVTLNEPRQAVILGMVFQMGLSRTKKFVNTLAAVRDGHWAHAAEGMRQSLWARQTPSRVARLAHQMEIGEWA